MQHATSIRSAMFAGAVSSTQGGGWAAGSFRWASGPRRRSCRHQAPSAEIRQRL